MTDTNYFEKERAIMGQIGILNVGAGDLRHTPGIYRIVHLPTGREYIGQAKNLWNRYLAHRRNLTGGMHPSRYLQRTWNRHRPNEFLFEPLLIVSKTQLTEIEQIFLDQRQPVFNTCRVAGSTRGVKASAETRAKMSAVRKGRRLTREHRAKISAANKANAASAEQRALASRMGKKNRGRKLSEETKALLSKVLTGRKVSPETRRRMSEAAAETWRRRRI